MTAREVRRQGDQLDQWPPLALLHHEHVVPGLLALFGVPSGAAEEPPGSLEELITTTEGCKDSLEE